MEQVITKRSSIKSVNPATNKVEKEFDEMNDQQIDQILDKATQTFGEWKTVSLQERAALLNKVASLMDQQKEELARLCTIEMGKLLKEGIAEVEICVGIFRYYAEKGAQLLADHPLDTPQGKAFVSYEPIGVLLSVQPWNFPFYQITRSAAPNIMAGNTIVLKHASNAPQCAAKMEEIFRQAGAPEGLYTNLFISGEKASRLVADPRVKGATLTGSEKAGSSFAGMAGQYVKKSLLELGGSDPFIVLEDADLDIAVQNAAMGRLVNAGQVCISPKRIIVPESVADEFIEKAKAIYQSIKVGDPMDAQTQLAPLSSEKALESVLKQVEDTVKQGATLVYGGKKLNREGCFMEPTILTDIKPGMVAYSQELFRPVLCIFKVKDEEEAIRLANDSEFGLGGSVFGKNTDHAVEVARKIDTDMVYINHVTGIAPELPFGGTKLLGYGREQSTDGIYEFVNKKLIRVTTPDAAY
ncbi:MAG: NAD-dependent succinate-semialdehyde dehydrogenase [Bacteroides sp.]|nr:NAD-dependent succinate-semialdehyde dehydrogenase [Bacteroides sp.]